MSTYYTTIEDIQQQLMKEAPTSTHAEYVNFVNYLLNQLIPEVSQYIDNYTHRFFVPLLESRSFYNRVLYKQNSLESDGYYLDTSYWNYKLFIDIDLLEINTFTSTATLISSSDYRINPPAWFIELDPDSNDFDFDTGSFNNAQIINGFWGYHTDWDNAFTASETITIDASSTDMTVADSSIYKRGGYVRCEDELMLVTAMPDGTSLTVTRGVRGTTAIGHTAKTLSTFAIEPALHIAATKLCSWLYLSRVSVGNVIQITDNTITLDTMPTMVKDNLERFIKRRN